ncbi:ribonuclease activity regulator RraA [Maribacter polysaccharolyticus]|uniref:ribonuclease activity regulator RraA n=1 Tax=Maribacter polysaccharolyticus TaxID=3020831 RepID=UPI00237F5091|nr:ribonuclease activity regulator RraA [Maribacter polysaccharolyticus]MDE3742818.1 ribonuclease activity regulator RraA [Maribacter polysaccharolyticus]
MGTNLNTTKEKLKKVSTATIATCLFKRGLKNQFIQDVKPLKPNKPNMVGEAYTLRYIPAREDLNPIEVFRDPKHLQRVAVEECPKGAVLVIDSRKDARAASAGSILATRLMVRGAAGLVTDGGFRDSAEIAALELPSYHNRPSAPTNLTLHQAISINEPIGCGDVAVFPGDILVGDDDGVMVIPAQIAHEVAEECIQMTLYEEFVIQQVKNGHAVIGLYPLVDEKIKKEFELWKKNNADSL